jgi:hypothetical protein
MDVDARMQLFDLKTKYQFQTVPGFDQYNMPLYDIQTSSLQTPIASFPVYQGFMAPARINGVDVAFHTQRSTFENLWSYYPQTSPSWVIANGGSNYTIPLPFFPFPGNPNPPITGQIQRGHVDITGILATGNNEDPPVSTSINLAIPTTSIFPAVYFTATSGDGSNAVVCDSGQFLTGNINLGLLMRPGSAPYGNVALPGGYTAILNTIDYAKGVANITFCDSAGGPINIPAGNPINVQVYCYAQGLPRAILYYNNILTVRSIPNTQYLVELDAYLTPAAFLNTGNALPFGYMAEYIARGAARKILSDTGDTEQFMFYEPLFKEQETLVWKRSQRQFTATRTETIYSRGMGGSNGNYNGQGQL